MGVLRGWKDCVVNDVLQGFGVIVFVIALGFVVGKLGILPPSTQEVLGKLAFWVLSPSLLFTVLSRADWSVLFSQLLPIFFLTTVVVLSVGAVLWGVFLKRGVTNTVFLTMCSGYTNANNIGIPVAAYILGDPALSAPIILFQVVIISPIALAILDTRMGTARESRLRVILRPLRNPIIVASAAGAFLSWRDISLPALVFEPFSLIGQAAVPVLLILLGWSMAGNNPFAQSPHRGDVFAVTAIKMVLMPVVAWVLGVWWMGLNPTALFAVVILSALPTGQNVFAFAVRYDSNVALARDSIMVTTLLAAVVFVAIAVFLA
jgi:malonate transporter